MQNLIFEYFSKCVNIADIYALWKFFFFAKCVDLVPNLTHIEIFFKVRNFSKCVVTLPYLKGRPLSLYDKQQVPRTYSVMDPHKRLLHVLVTQ